MKCHSPESVTRPGGQGPQDRVTVPCGNCVSCLGNRRHDWSFRLWQELKSSSSAKFVTLTYRDEDLPFSSETGEAILLKKDLQAFIQDLRNEQARNEAKLSKIGRSFRREAKNDKIRYFAVGEYGSKGRPHYHALIFNMDPFTEKRISCIWKKGFVKVDQVNQARIYYVTKYLINRKKDETQEQKTFTIMSRRPGIGNSYLSRTKAYHRGGNYTVRMQNGRRHKLPRYYSDKIFTEEELKQIKALTIEYLDKSQAELHDKLRRNGNNPFEYDLEQKKQITQKVIKNSKTKL